MPDTKTKKHKRSVPYLPELFEVHTTLLARKKPAVSPHLGAGHDEEKRVPENKQQKYLFEDITDDSSKQYFCALYKDLKFDLNRHSTRHTFVSVCTFLGIPPEVIQRWAGHTDLKMTTETYTHKLRKGTSPILDYLTKLKSTVHIDENLLAQKTKTPCHCEPARRDKPTKQSPVKNE